MSQSLCDDDIAVVGMAGRFPGAGSVDELWDNLVAGTESIRFYSDEELRERGVDEARLADPAFVKAGAPLDGIEEFDAEFFGFNPREAEVMDPQHRLFLETAWHALEDAGHHPGSFDGEIGLVVGVGMSGYLDHHLTPNRDLAESLGPMQIVLGNEKDSLSVRTAYLLDLRGPCLTVQTYCSTSLVAVSLACENLLAGTCDMALAGGVAIFVPQDAGYLYQEGGVTSPDGRCRPFDASSRGAPLGSGLGVVVLRRLGEALADGDNVRAIIRGTAVNNDGSHKVSFTAPGVTGQAAVVAEALAAAEVEPESIGYIEAHGTGTELGDPIELAALRRVFGGPRADGSTCAIGSVKSNVGHLDRAAGITSLIKTVLTLERGQIPPTLNFERPNPQLELDAGPFRVCTELEEWGRGDRPRRAGVSSFGIGGTNAHVVLEEAPVVEPADDTRGAQLLVLSAKSEEALAEARRQLAERLRGGGSPAIADAGLADASLADVAFTLQVGRAGHAHRLFVVCSDLGDASDKLASEGAGAVAVGTARSEPEVVFWISDGGDRTCGVDAALHEAEPAYRDAVDRCNREIVALGAAVVEAGDGPSAGARFVGLYALAELWRGWGIEPTAVEGTGDGERVAAVLSETLPLAEALSAAVDPSEEAPEGTASEVPAELSSDGRIALEIAPPAPGRDSRACLLETLGRLWLRGVQVDWRALHPASRRRVRLPGYPFERRRFWVEAPSAPGPGAQAAVESAFDGKLPDPEDWFYAPRWVESLRRPYAAEELSGPWLLLVDLEGLGDLVAGLLRERGERVTVVRRAEAQNPHGGDETELPLGDDRGLEEIVDGMAEPPRRVVHFWASGSAADGETTEEDEELGFFSLAALGKALVRKALARKTPDRPASNGGAGDGGVDLTVVTRGVYAIERGDQIAPARALALGPVRVLPQEHPDLGCRLIDLPLAPKGVSGGAAAPGAGEDLALVSRRLLAEIEAGGEDSVVALRGEQRWVQDFAPAPMPEAQRPPFRQNGVYLVTGGFGGVGAVIARHLAETHWAKLALLGRSAPDAAARELLAELAALGGEGLPVRADVADEASLAAAIASAEEAFGGLDGVIHAAGLSDPANFQEILQLDRPISRRHFSGKVHGVASLGRALAGRDLDFCLVMSSLSTVLGGLSFAAYTAANAHLDAFVRRAWRRSDRQWFSVAWDGWRIDRSTGVPFGGTVARFEMSPEEGMEAMTRALAAPVTANLVHSTGHLGRRLEQWSRPRAEKRAAGPAHPRPNLPNPFVAPASEVETALAAIWEEVLGIEPVGSGDDFFDLGGHSLLATQVFTRVRALYGVELPLIALFEARSVSALAALVETVRWSLRSPAMDPALAGSEEREEVEV